MKIIKCGLLIDGTGAVPKKDQAVVIEGDRIKEICSFREIDVLAAKEKAQVIHGEDSFVIPGLIDSHVHLSFSGSADPAGDLQGDSDGYLMVRQVRNAQAALKAGITMVRDCGSRGMSLLALRDAVNKGFIQGSRIFASGVPITTTGGHCHFLGRTADSKEEAVRQVRKMARDGADFIKVMLSGGNMTKGSNPQIVQYSQKQAERFTREAHMLGKTVAAHVLNKKSIEIAVKAGIDTLEHCAFLSEKGTPDFDPAVIEIAIEKGLYISPAMNYGTLAGYVPAFGESREDPEVKKKIAFWDELTETRFSTTREMVKMGAKIIAGTDAGTKRTGFEDYWKALKAMNERGGMTAMQVLESATRLPAEAMGISQNFGTIEAGKMADIVVLQKNPLEDLQNLTSISWVILGGKAEKTQ